jgi:hypothetical protein
VRRVIRVVQRMRQTRSVGLYFCRSAMNVPGGPPPGIAPEEACRRLSRRRFLPDRCLPGDSP